MRNDVAMLHGGPCGHLASAPLRLVHWHQHGSLGATLGPWNSSPGIVTQWSVVKTGRRLVIGDLLLKPDRPVSSARREEGGSCLLILALSAPPAGRP